MIRPLRRLHRRIWQVAALALPLLLIVAILTRQPTHPAPHVRTPATAGESTWPGLPLGLRREASGLRVRALGPLPAPDLLLYAATAPVEKGQPLPAGSVFLGSVSGPSQVLATPPSATDRLVLYSLAHGEVVGSTAVPREGR